VHVTSVSNYSIDEVNCMVFPEKAQSPALQSFESIIQQGNLTRTIILLLSILPICHSGRSAA